MTRLLALRRALALTIAAALLTVGALPAHAATPFTVTGRVAFPDGYTPQGDRDLYLVLRAPGGGSDRVDIARDGTFTITAPDSTATYTLFFYDSEDFLFDGVVKADGTVAVSNAPSLGLSSSTPSPLTIAPRLSSAIKGKIELPAGVAMKDTSFQIVRYSPIGSGWAGSGVLSSNDIDENGEFDFRGLDAGATYRLELRDLQGTFVTGFYGPGGYVEHLGVASSVTAPASDIVFKPVRAATISGRVTAPSDVDPTALAGNGVTIQLSTDTSTDEVLWQGRTVAVEADGAFTIRDLWPGSEMHLGAYTPRLSLEPGFLDSSGALVLDRSRARTVLAGATDVNIKLRHGTQFSGTVELPAGFAYDAENPPTVRVIPHVEEPQSFRWTSALPYDVGRDGSFTTGRAHSQAAHTLELTWPDGSVVYWTGDRSRPSPTASKAKTQRPRDGVVFSLTDAMDNLRAPRISGVARFGGTLEADGGSWSAPSARLSYQWLRGGTPISGATSKTYKIAKGDVGSALTVAVTASAAGFATRTAQSAPTSRVAKARTTLAAAVAKGTSRSKLKLTVRVGTGGVVSDPTGTVRVAYGKKSRVAHLEAKHRGVMTVTVPRSKPTGTVSVSFTPAGDSARHLEASSAKVKVSKVTPTIKVKAPKKLAAGTWARFTVRVGATPLTRAPRGTITLTVGSKAHKVKLLAKHRGTVTVRVRLAKGTSAVRARFVPHSTWKKFIKSKKSKRTVVRAR